MPSIDLAAPRNDVLRPGLYFYAERAAFRTGRSPGLDVTGESRGCNEIWGEFLINQIETGADGSVSRLDALFVQRCESNDRPSLFGQVLYNALPLSYEYRSDAGDYIGAGQQRAFIGATSVFGVRGTVDRGVEFSVSGQREEWSVELAPVAGQPLGVGTYADAQRAAFREPGHPGLDVHGQGRGCNQLSGSFEITELEADEAGTVTALAASYVQHCEGMAPALRGSIAYHAGSPPSPTVLRKAALGKAGLLGAGAGR